MPYHSLRCNKQRITAAAEIDDFSGGLVRVARFERAASSSQSWRPTDWATPGNMKFWRLCCYYTTLADVVKHVVMGRFFRETQGRGTPRDHSKIRASQVSRRRRRTGRVHAPKAGALPTGLHPEI